jgi:hypothetical protein
MPTKVFFLKFFANYFLQVHLHPSAEITHSVIKKPQNCRKSRFFLGFCLLLERNASGSVQIITDLDPGGPKTYEFGRGSGPLEISIVLNCTVLAG